MSAFPARLLLPLLLLLAAAVPASAKKLDVVCTIPDLADVVREIGGDRVEVRSIAKGRENVHDVRIKPSHIVAVARADVFVQIGLSLEHAWVPGLLEVARNRQVQPGGPGFVNVGEGWEAIMVPTNMSRDQGADIHPQGNPHLNLSPRGGRHMARAVHAALLRLDPEAREGLDERLAAYERRLDEAEARWTELGQGLAGKKIVLYHRDLDYFMRAHGMELVGTVEPKPGMPPSPGHMVELIERMREEGCTTVVVAPWCNNDQARRVAEQAGAEVVEVPQMVDGVKGSSTWIDMMDLLHRRIADAVLRG